MRIAIVDSSGTCAPRRQRFGKLESPNRVPKLAYSDASPNLTH